MLIKKARRRQSQVAEEKVTEVAAQAERTALPESEQQSADMSYVPAADDSWTETPSELEVSFLEEAQLPPEPELPYSIEAIEQGVLPERRKRVDPYAPNSDRREPGVYRRLEDRELISRAQEEANHIREQSRYEGYQQGYEEGLNAAEATLQPLRDAITGLDAVQQQAVQAISGDLIPLAVSIAERIIRAEVTLDDSLVVSMAKDMAAAVDASQKQLMLKANPADVDVLKTDIDQDPNWTFNGREVVVMADPSVEQGSCIVETAAGQVDGSFATQLEMVRRLLGLSG